MGLPEERVKYMLDDCGAELLLTKSEIIDNYSVTNILGYSENITGAIKTPNRPLNEKFDNIPFPDRSLINYEKYFKHIGQGMVKYSVTLQATRGCPYDCAYCCRMWPRKTVMRSAENIFAEVMIYYKMGIKRFVFIDDIFNLNKENSIRFFKLVIENGLKINILFPSGLRGNILTKEYIDMMVKAGVISFPLSLETASPRLQKLIKKNLKIETFQSNLEYILEKYPQIIVELNTMHGFPTETKEEALMTLNFIKSHKFIHFPYIHILKIHSNTDMVKIAMENGITEEQIMRSQTLAYHILPDSLPFNKNFTLSYQTEFLNEYFLNKERLIQVLSHQMRVLTEDELVQKYNSYLPVKIRTFNELLDQLNISLNELPVKECLSEEEIKVTNFNKNVQEHFKRKTPKDGALKVLLLDLSQYYSNDADMLYDVVEQPLGLMYLMTYLNKKFEDNINGKIAKSRVDFDSHQELKDLLKDFNPDVIGIRSLSFYKEFFHKTVSKIRNWGYDIPIIAGGPYATTDYNRILLDKNINVVVLGEGEITFSELIEAIIKNNKKLPHVDILSQIPGLAFSPVQKDSGKKTGREVVLLDEINDNILKYPSGNLNVSVNSSDLSYIIYTSGTTGKPKGVMIKQYNVTSVVKDTNYISINENDKILQLSNYAFDGSVFDIFGAILNGATLALIKKDNISEINQLGNIIKKEEISVLFVTTALFNSLVDYGIDYLVGLKKLLFGGERVSFKHVKKAFQTLGKDKIIHVYGPTETTVYATYYPVDNIDDSLGTIPIGKPLSNKSVYVLDKELNLLPIDVSGELCISGDGNSCGYLGREELTKEKFIDNPYSGGEKLYRTGDLVRWLPDGNIEFLGRIDNQVKIRGFRIELGEIEHQLSNYKSIKEVIILVDEREGNKTLIAYYVSTETIDHTELKGYLLEKLPAYMVPSYFISLESMPLTVNGKIDRKKLPKPETEAGKEFRPPSNEIEEKLIKIWSDVLKIKKEEISVSSNFFEFGGNSITSIALVNEIYKDFNVEFPVSRVFELETVKNISDYIADNSNYGKYSPIKRVERKEYYPLSSSQIRLFANYLFNEVKTAYNMPFIFKLPENTGKTRIEEFVRILVRRHESLRTTFHLIDNEMVQKVHKSIEFQVEVLEIKSNLQETISNFSEQFDLSKAPLFKIGILLYNGQKYLMFDIHHIISDGISQGIIENEFMKFQNGEELKKVEIQYKDFVNWQKSEWFRKKINQQEKYWLGKFSDDLPVLNLPTDFARNDKKYNGNSMAFITDESLTNLIRQKCKEGDVTLFMMLVSIFKIFLSKLSGQQDIIVGVPVAGRTHPKLKDVVGMFVNYLPLRSYPVADKHFQDYLLEVKAEILKTFDNQDYQYDELVEKVVKKNNPGRNPLFDVVFNFVNIGEVTNLPESQLMEMNRLLRNTSKVDILITATESTNNIMFDIEYDSRLFNEETIKFVISSYRTLIQQVCSNLNVELHKITLVDASN